MCDDQRREADPILLALTETLRKVDTNFQERQTIRRQRGDDPLPGKPFITVTVETEHRTYTGHMFDMWSSLDATLDLYDVSVTDPTVELADPCYIIRVESIVSARVAENPEFLPVEFAMTRATLDAAVESFIAKVDDILIPGPDKCNITTEQCDALRDAAQPVNDLIFKSSIPSRWERYSRAIDARNGRTPKQRYMTEDHKTLNMIVVNTEDKHAHAIPLIKFLTHGVPLDFLYTETHQTCIDKYRLEAEDAARMRKRTR
jgi:hypothetical protein